MNNASFTFALVAAALLIGCLPSADGAAVKTGAEFVCAGISIAADEPGVASLCATVAEVIAAIATIEARAKPGSFRVPPTPGEIRKEILAARSKT